MSIPFILEMRLLRTSRMSSVVSPTAFPHHLCHLSSQRCSRPSTAYNSSAFRTLCLLSARPSSALGPLRARPMHTYSRPSLTTEEAPVVFCAPLLHARLLNDSISFRYSLDTNVVSLILNGELWDRSPYDLIRARSYLTWVCKYHTLEQAPDIDPELLWYIKAWGRRYVRIAEVNGNYWKVYGVWPMAASELCLEMSGW